MNERLCLQIKLHLISNIENLLCILKESKAKFLRLRLMSFKKVNVDSVSHGPNCEVYSKREIFIKGRNKCVEVIYDEEFTFNDT